MADNFFDEQTEQSEIKAELIAKYFPAYMRVIGSAQKQYGGDRIAYIDLFAGPGRYKDGAKSTPIKIIEQAISDEDMRQRLVAIFNDKDEANVESLRKALESLPNYDTLRHKPTIYHGEVGEDIVKMFEEMKLVPTLFFVDPWGYKGMTLRLINSVLKDWGCDCCFFFNYSRINMGLENEAVETHMDSLFGKKRADLLRARFKEKDLKPTEREAFIVEEMCQAISEMGGKFVLPFRFHNKQGTRITHHLFFVTKHFRGYSIMKDIMRAHCTGKHDGAVNFEYNPADHRQPALYALLSPITELGDMLRRDLVGKVMSIDEIYEVHSVGKPYVLKEYREVLCKLEQDKAITIDPPCPPRRKGTLACTQKSVSQQYKQEDTMSAASSIEWTDATWNPVRGCTKISPGCVRCYAATFAERFRGVVGHPYEQGFDLKLVPDKLGEPLRWSTSKTIFVNSMSDLFHSGVPDEYIERVARVMELADWHTYQVLTKRPERMRALLEGPLAFASELKHVWWGTSVENRKHGLPRVDVLRSIPVPVRFLSVEPLLEELGEINLQGIGWVIVGGESGAGARPMHKEWVLSLRDQCAAAGVPFFFKQWGGVRKAVTGRELEGQTYNAMPSRIAARKPISAKFRLEVIDNIQRWEPDLQRA